MPNATLRRSTHTIVVKPGDLVIVIRANGELVTSHPERGDRHTFTTRNGNTVDGRTLRKLIDGHAARRRAKAK